MLSVSSSGLNITQKLCLEEQLVASLTTAADCNAYTALANKFGPALPSTAARQHKQAAGGSTRKR